MGNSFIVSDGTLITYGSLPERVERVDFSAFSKNRTLKYAKKEFSELGDQMLITDTPIAIACSQYHYFILHRESLTILSTINESVVAYYEGVNIFVNIIVKMNRKR